jgi:hypothetical protein
LDIVGTSEFHWDKVIDLELGAPRPRKSIARKDLLFHRDSHTKPILVARCDFSGRKFRIWQQRVLSTNVAGQAESDEKTCQAPAFPG